METLDPPIHTLVASCHFSRLVFSLPEAVAPLQTALQFELAEYDFRPENLHLAFSSARPTDWTLSLQFLWQRAALRVWIGGFELTFWYPTWQDKEAISEMLLRVERAVSTSLPRESLARRDLFLSGHFPASEAELAAHGRRFASELPSGLGRPAFEGAVLRLRTEAFSEEAVVVFDRSAVLPSGIFVSIQCRFDSAEYDARSSVTVFSVYARTVLQTLDLEQRDAD
jgi:hypothetical protein